MDYRPEIDGLRAVAVLPVILFHAGVPLFGGGYVGVDIFFVISGYLITSIILAEQDAGKFSLINFYERRARRILPPLYLVMAACIPFAWLWFAPGDWAGFARSLIAVTTFWSNILFWSESGYFNAAAEFKPLLHTWSLAVEEQYYLLFPVFLMLTGALSRKVLLFLLGGGFAISLMIAQWGSIAEPNAAFYLLPTRGWELLIGCFVAFFITYTSFLSVNMKWRQAASLFGFGLILIAVFGYSKNTPFPGVYALVPTIGTVLIILFAVQGTWLAKLLRAPVLVQVGLMSYSAYLWHQPLLAFAKYRSASSLSGGLIALIILATFVLSYATWRWVEKPVRAKQRGGYVISARALWIGAGVSAALFIAIGLGVNNTKWHFGQLTDQQRIYYEYLDYGRSSAFEKSTGYGVCFLGSDSNDDATQVLQDCLEPSPDKLNVILLGDSHAAHLRQALIDNLPQVNLMQANASGCRPVMPLSGELRCVQMMRSVYEEFLPAHNIDSMIISARWRQEDIPALVQTIVQIQQHVDDIYIVGPTLEYSRDVVNLLIMASGPDEISAIAQRAFVAENFALDRQMRRKVEAAGGHYISVYDALCKDQICPMLLPDGTPLVFDDSHFTDEGAQHFVAKLVADKQLMVASAQQRP